MKKIRNSIEKIIEWVLISLLGIMVINVLWQVFSRFFTSNPSSFTDELARYLMIWLGILGAAYVAGINEHVAIDFFAKKYKNIFITFFSEKHCFSRKNTKKSRFFRLFNKKLFFSVQTKIDGCFCFYFNF